MAMAVGGKALGYMVETGPDFIRESDTFTCQHCNTVHETADRRTGQKKDLVWCKRCMGLICPGCMRLSCDPVAAKLERQEQLGRRVAAENIERALEQQAWRRALDGRG